MRLGEDTKFDEKISLEKLWAFGTKIENRYWG
jgi:hypothetical protein